MQINYPIECILFIHLYATATHRKLSKTSAQLLVLLRAVPLIQQADAVCVYLLWR